MGVPDLPVPRHPNPMRHRLLRLAPPNQRHHFSTPLLPTCSYLRFTKSDHSRRLPCAVTSLTFTPCHLARLTRLRFS
jgi:hypothetical protein